MLPAHLAMLMAHTVRQHLAASLSGPADFIGNHAHLQLALQESTQTSSGSHPRATIVQILHTFKDGLPNQICIRSILVN